MMQLETNVTLTCAFLMPAISTSFLTDFIRAIGHRSATRLSCTWHVFRTSSINKKQRWSLQCKAQHLIPGRWCQLSSTLEATKTRLPVYGTSILPTWQFLIKQVG